MDEYRQPVPGLPGLRQRYSLNIFPWALALVAIAILIRLPFFFHDVLNWDESTFILGKHRILSRSQFSVFLLFLIGVGFSILQSGGAHEHYLIQLVPFMALGAAISLRPLFVKPLKIPIVAAIVLLLLFSLQPVLSKYRVLIGSIRAGEPLQRGPAYEIADYLRAEQVGDRPVYMMTDHIVYWLIGSQPLTRATTHPSNISKQFLLP